MALETSVSVAIDLESNAPQIAGDSAAALEAMKDAISASRSELAGMNKALRDLRGGGVESAGAVKQLKEQIAATKASIAQQTAAFVKAGGSFKDVKKPIEESRGSIAKWLASISGLPGPVGSVVGKLGGLGRVMAVGVAIAFAAALVAVAAAAAHAAMSLAGFALQAANARRNEELQLQGLSKYRNFWAEMVPGFRRAADSSGFLQKQLDEVAASSSLGRDRISEMQAELYRAGLRSGNLQAALEGLAIAESTQGAEGAAQFKARALGAALYGGSVKKVSDDIKARLGGVAKAQMLSLDVQTRKLRENMNLLFKSLRIEKLLEGISVITSMFSQSTAAGRALKAMIDGFFQPLIDSASGASIYVKRFFQGVVIAALKFGMAVLVVRNYLRDTFGDSEWWKSLDKGRLMVNLGSIAFYTLAGAVLAGVLVLGLMAAAMLAVMAPVIVLGAALYGLVQVGKDVWGWFKATSWTDIGLAIPRGIANGIKSGIGWVIDAMKEMALKPMFEFKARMGIRSPSRLAYGVSLNVPKGTALAYRAGIPEVKGAARQMAEASEAGMRAGTRNPGDFEAPMPARREPLTPGGAASGGGKPALHLTVPITDGAIVVSGARDPDAVAKEILMQVEERVVNIARQLGASL